MKKTLTFYSALFMLFLVLQRVAGALTKIVLANTITPYEYGLITLVAISIPAMIQLTANLNFFYILIHASEGKKHFGLSLTFSILITLLLSLILFFFHEDFFNYLNLPLDNWEFLYSIIIISSLTLIITVNFQGLFTGLKLYFNPGMIMTLPSLFRLLFIFIIIYFFHNLVSFELIILIFAISYAIPLIYIVLSKQLRGYFGLAKSIIIPSKKMFAFSFTIFIVGSFSLIGQSLVKIVISHELGIEWQGFYDVSLTLVSILLFSLTTMNFISIPEATSLNNEKIYEKHGLGDVSRALFSFLMFLIIILYFFSDYMVIKLFSEDYIISSKYIYILIASYPFLFVQSFLSKLNMSHAKNIKDYNSLFVITLLFIPLFYFLTEFLISYFETIGYGNGFIGGYLSYTMIVILYSIITIYYSQDLTPLKILLHKIDRLIGSIVFTSLTLFYFNPPALLGIFTSAILFTSLVLISGYINKSLIFEMFKGKKM